MDKAWTIKQVAGLLSVNERTVYRLANAGKLPGFKVGGHWRFLPADVEEWIRMQKQASVPGDTWKSPRAIVDGEDTNGKE